MDDSEDDVLAYLAFPAQLRTKLHSTNPLERRKRHPSTALRRAALIG
jgi:transposase-like protein